MARKKKGYQFKSTPEFEILSTQFDEINAIREVYLTHRNVRAQEGKKQLAIIYQYISDEIGDELSVIDAQIKEFHRQQQLAYMTESVASAFGNLGKELRKARMEHGWSEKPCMWEDGKEED
jgi:hypothetical protein